LLTDLLLAIAHHLLIFALFGLLVTEMVMLKPDISAGNIIRLARIDMAFGIVAGLIVIVGFSRVHFGLKGPEFYEQNPIFWAKIAAFVVVGLLSVQPTLRMIRWRRAVSADPAFRPPTPDVLRTKRFMHYEGVAFVFILIFAAMMARGYGL
jgi:putative membrane protein